MPVVASDAGLATARTGLVALFFFFVERGIVVFYDVADSIEILAKSVNFPPLWGVRLPRPAIHPPSPQG